MTNEQYWEGEPYLTVIYRDVDTRRRVEKNEFLWLQGMYVYEAFAVVLSNAFAKKGSKAQHYPDKPYRITPPTEEEKKAAAEAERKKAIASLTAWKAAWDQRNA